MNARASIGLALVIVPAALATGCAPRLVWYGKSPDRTHEVAVVEDAGGQRVRVDGRDGRTYAGVGLEAMAWSPDGRRLAYAAKRAAGWVVVDGGVEGPAWEGVGPLTWSATGGHLAYPAARRGRWTVAFDHVPTGWHEAIRSRSIRMSADGSHVAYVAEDASQVAVVLDGRPSPAFDAIAKLTMSAAGRVAFVGRRGELSSVWVDGTERARGDDVADLAVSPDGRRLAWIVRAARGWQVVVDGVAGEPFDRVGRLVFGRSGRLAYAAALGDAEVVVVDDVTFGPYAEVRMQSLSFDAAGRRVAFSARREGREMVVLVDDATDRLSRSLGGAPQGSFDAVGPPIFAGSLVAYPARLGARSFVVLGTRAGAAHGSVAALAVSPDGSRYAFVATDAGVTRLIEGTFAHGAPDEVRASRLDAVVDGTVVFTDDGAHVGCVEGDPRTRALYLVVDGRRAHPFDTEAIVASASVDPAIANGLVSGSALAGWVRAETAAASRRR